MTNQETRQAAARATRTASAKGATITALRELAPMAKEINVRLEKATQLTDNAYDHRLAAALQLDQARQRCKIAKIPFKGWISENVTQTYETVRKLASVGAAEDPVKALEDMRGNNRKANKKLRAKKAAVAAQTPEQRILEGFKHVEEAEAVELIKAQAQALGLALEKPAGHISLVTEMKSLFQMASGSDQRVILWWIADELDVDIVEMEHENG